MANPTIDSVTQTLVDYGLDLTITRNGEPTANANAVDTDLQPDTRHIIRAVIEDLQFEAGSGTLKLITAGGDGEKLALNDVVSLDGLNYTVNVIKPIREGSVIVMYQTEAVS